MQRHLYFFKLVKLLFLEIFYIYDVKFLLTLFSLTSFIILNAQSNLTQTISGSVKDIETNQSIIGAYVVVLNSEPLLGTTTDIDGNFSIENVPIGLHNIKISYLGYQNKFFNDIYLTSAKGLNLDIKLQEDAFAIKEITVTAKRNKENVNEMATVSVNTVTAKEAERISGGIADPQRIILSYAGVKNQGDVNNGISIRGNSPTGMLWQLEGVEIQDPNHFTVGGSFGGRYINGAVSAISSNLLENINLYTGAFPAQYGNATSGIMDLTLRKGNDKNFEYNFNLGVLGVEASAEGPIQMGGSFLISYRYSTLGLMSNLGFNVGGTQSNYQDLNYKIHIPTKKLGTFSAFGIAGWSTNKDKKYFEVNERTFRVTYNNSVFGLSHQFNTSKKSYIKNTISFSQTKNIYHYYNEIEYELNQKFQLDTIREYYDKDQKTLRFNSIFHYKINNRNKLVAGINTSLPQLNLISGIDSKIFDYSNEDVDFKNATVYLQAYAQWKHRFSKTLSINTGLHYLHFTYNNNFSIEPRFSLKWQAHQNHLITFGTGLHSKIEFLPVYMTAKAINKQEPTTINKDLELTKSFHVAASYTFTPVKNLNFKIEPYLQYLFDVPQYTRLRKVQNNDPVIFRQSIDTFYYSESSINRSREIYNRELDNEGTGLNYGLEITAHKQFAKNYYGIMSSSFYRAFYKSPEIKTWQPTNFDGLFVFSATTGKDFIIGRLKQNKISINARFLWSGGYFDHRTFKRENRIVRAKNYYKLDTRIAYILNRKNFTFTSAIDILNTTNHINETNDFLVQGSGILPVLSFNFRFQTNTKE